MIKIHIGEKTYTATITPRILMKCENLFADISRRTQENPDESLTIEDVALFIANDLFRGQFTFDEFMDGYESNTVQADMLGIVAAVRGAVLAKIAEFPASEGPDDEKNVKRDSEA